MAGLCAPLPTLHPRPPGRRRTARGRCGSLLLHRSGLSPPTPCRSPGAHPSYGLMSRPNLLMLDEPSLGLAPIVIEQVFDKILELNKRTGLGVLLVEQNSAMALEIASRAFVLETGAITLSGPAESLARDPRIREAYLGG